ncbi:hypothetical protein SISSUDRAFT_993875 [Sistotremastrum suecicum HHB10207 ss-3]|uniref:Fe2OG dioxygenase domain-containing protein n=1 Tax=Sistotremastrum suecicum HHB10207 ss-3 TaxID=1314776 RepID=A0A165XXW7_9AGAM|nr:hypothetical protein SISSUDRAFT_993875 [Sistotremastrum suecicum HHB10207 ss-3]
MSNTSSFIPEIHLEPLVDDPGFILLSDLGFEPTAYSPIAASKPFPLFTPEAVRRIRAEIVDHETLANHMFSDDNNPCVVRGHCPDKARFTYDAWTHESVKERVDQMAGIPITIVYDYEIGHTNIQLGPRGWAGLKAEPDMPSAEGNLAVDAEIEPTVYKVPNWHKDSYPFVCILMLSETSTFKGGNTFIRKADGTNLVCPLPPIGHAMILQGGLLDHAVSPTSASQERLSMVTSYRPSDPLQTDSCRLNTVRTVSEVPVLHKQWLDYRLKLLAERATKFAQTSDSQHLVEEMDRFIREQSNFLQESMKQMTDPVERVSTDTRGHFKNWLDAQAPTVVA